MINVNVEVNSTPWLKKIRNPEKYLNKKLKKISRKIKFIKNKNLIFSILLTNSINMKRLNKKFRKQNKATDVLSFPSFFKKKLKSIKKKNVYIGDIAISYEIIDSRSKKKNFLLEFNKVWIHGFLHLLGYDHLKTKDYYEMNKMEKRVLTLI